MTTVRLLVGTHKGAFILTSDERRERWKIDGPEFIGWDVYHVKGSPVDPNRLYASQSRGWFGQVVQRSDDGGKTWEPAGNEFKYEGAINTHKWYDNSDHPYDFTRVWHLEPSLTDADTVYAGVEDAALFKSTDAGKSWEELDALRHHPTAPSWAPGAGGLCLHTIIQDPTNPDRLVIAISSAGAFRTDDAGKTWTPINKGLRSNFIPDQDAEVGHCVHHIAMHPSRPNVLFMQKHWDVMRSDNAGDSWTARARDDLRRADQERLGPFRARRQAARLPEQERGQRVGGAHQRPSAEGLLRQRASRRDERRQPRVVRRVLRHDGG